LPTAKYVCEDAGYWAAKENHPHGERTYPGWKRGEEKGRNIMTWKIIFAFIPLYTIHISKNINKKV
jgi:hypothetical protein